MGGPLRRSRFRRILVTGGCGFLASTFIRQRLEGDPEVLVTALDSAVASGCRRLSAFLKDPRLRVVQGDAFDDRFTAELAADADAALSFVTGSRPQAGIAMAPRLVQVSGLQQPQPSGVGQALSVRVAPTYGPFQDPEEPVAELITRALEGKPLPIPKRQRTPQAFVFAEDAADAIARVLWKGNAGMIYDVAGSEPVRLSDVAAMVLGLTGRTGKLAVKEGLTYALSEVPTDARAIRQLGWEPRHSLIEGLSKTIEWYRGNTDWWHPVS